MLESNKIFQTCVDAVIACNLICFSQSTVAKGADFDNCVENIDIGKNFFRSSRRCAVMSDNLPAHRGLVQLNVR